MTRVKRWVTLATAGLVLALVFAAYLQPEFMVGVANQIWGCW